MVAYVMKKDYIKALVHIELAKVNYKFISEFMVNSQIQYVNSLREQKRKLEWDIKDMEQIIREKRFKGTTPEQQYSQLSETKGKVAHAQQTLSEIDQRLHTPIPKVPETREEFCYIHGNILFKLKRYQDAYSQYSEVVRINPDHGKAHNNLANLNFMGRRYKEALSHVKRAEECGIKVDPEFKDSILDNFKIKQDD